MIRTWTPLSPMSRVRDYHSCGLVNTQTKHEIVVTSNEEFRTVDIFNLKNMTWRKAGKNIFFSSWEQFINMILYSPAASPEAPVLTSASLPRHLHLGGRLLGAVRGPQRRRLHVRSGHGGVEAAAREAAGRRKEQGGSFLCKERVVSRMPVKGVTCTTLWNKLQNVQMCIRFVWA